ncbi:flagellar biosynthesis protein FlhG [Caloramator quimbayensis]|uniref:Flagellar biosynthesis protein FlhG n=1 Tax=Caloramator quimbayensis TaxID=1147123 RepID=A0A1T4XA37_9CLOT|nr:MinD/ParA family protein [Caloramator quimbayensis]SKA86482.1 flagellar biosynthesis protein FlhG [Caloramator quimbayensis]
MDQAYKLRNLINSKKQIENNFRVIAVSSGKGGVGKTNFAVNLAIALKKRGLRVSILDADFGMANVDILFGIKTRYTIYDILYNDKTIDDVYEMTEEGVKIIPGGSGISELFDLDDEKRKKIIDEFSKINDIDILIIDTGAGLSKTTLTLLNFADDIIVITNSEPCSLTDAYSLIKVICRENIKSNIGVVVNRAKNIIEGRETFNKLSNAIKIFLDKEIKYLGYICEDHRVINAVREQKPFISMYPRCEAGLCINKITSEILGTCDNNKNATVKEYFSKILKFMGR